ncbi:J domain-containing protein [Maricaulis parjimensis]|uniref:J domain-containing protein n=1 Tax=Maricaulis parjimensis TaxID=144023 RepID=UPI00193A4871|nr:J domain-containing protein [Maricaulis parjimensis]
MGAFLGAAWWFSRQKTQNATRMVRYLLGGGALLAGVVLCLRGAIMLGGPIGLFGLGLLGQGVGGFRMGGGGSGQRQAPPAPSRRMSLAEAREILGVAEDADMDTIQQAHRRLMKKLHPDTGEGSAALARQVHEARDVLAAHLDGKA